MPRLSGQLVDPDRLDAAQIRVRATPLDRPLHRAKHLGHLFPGKPLRPAGKKPGLSLGQAWFLARSPGQLLNPHPAPRAVHPARGIDQKHQDTPNSKRRDAPSEPLSGLRTPRCSAGITADLPTNSAEEPYFLIFLGVDVKYRRQLGCRGSTASSSSSFASQ
jgi:hypothetical protein